MRRRGGITYQSNAIVLATGIARHESSSGFIENFLRGASASGFGEGGRSDLDDGEAFFCPFQKRGWNLIDTDGAAVRICGCIVGHDEDEARAVSSSRERR
jgi:hypothetical protein